MRKSLFPIIFSILAMIALFSGRAFGDKLAGPVEFKIMGGASLAKSTEPIPWYLMDTFPVSEYGLGAVCGGGIEFLLTRTIRFEIDAFFIQKACRIELRNIDDAPVSHFMERLNEISFPLLYKFCLKPGTSPFLLAGGEIAFVLTRGPKRMDYSLVGGLGFRKKIRRSAVSIEGRYHHGLQDTLTDSSMLRKMRTFALIAGFSF